MNNLYSFSADLQCLEYSPSQKAFHQDDLRHIMDKNLEDFMSKRLNDFVIIFIGTEKQCDIMAENLKAFRY